MGFEFSSLPDMRPCRRVAGVEGLGPMSFVWISKRRLVSVFINASSHCRKFERKFFVLVGILKKGHSDAL